MRNEQVNLYKVKKINAHYIKSLVRACSWQLLFILLSMLCWPLWIIYVFLGSIFTECFLAFTVSLGMLSGNSLALSTTALTSIVEVVRPLRRDPERSPRAVVSLFLEFPGSKNSWKQRQTERGWCQLYQMLWPFTKLPTSTDKIFFLSSLSNWILIILLLKIGY